MAFCTSCGQQLADGAKFCSKCGAANSLASYTENKRESQTVYPAEEASVYSERKQEYAGKIIKCPSCGAELSSFLAICPDCGHEINSQKVSPYIRDFSKSIDALDQLIANEPEPPQTGWCVWRKGRRFFWVLLNMLTFCIPLVIYLTWPLIKPYLFPKKAPVLSTTEKRKAAFIKNATFPNERETTIEAMLLIKSKMAFLSSEKINKKTLYWSNLWNIKAEQLKQRADIILKNEPIVEDAFKDIITNKTKIRNNARKRAIIGAAVVVVCLAVAIFCNPIISGGKIFSFSTMGGPGKGKIESLTLDDDSDTDEDEGIYAYQIRNYVGRNVASFNTEYNEYEGHFTDSYGRTSLRLIFVAKDGLFISPSDVTSAQYTVVDQSLAAGSKLLVVHQRDSKGDPYSSLVDYQSYEEIVLFVALIGDTNYNPNFTESIPTLDRHEHHIRDYIGRNTATFKVSYDGRLYDTYGRAFLYITLNAEDGSYVDVNSLEKYVVVSQDLAPNTALKITFDKDSAGVEYSSLIKSQNYEEITLNVRRLNDITSEIPSSTSEDKNHEAVSNFSVTVPEEFTSGYEYAVFEKYNSPASENGLGESKVYFYGVLDKTEILEADGTTTILGYVTDDSGNQWLILMHTVPIVSESSFDKYIGEQIVLRGVYGGFSSVKNMPVVTLDEMIVLGTGEKVFGMQKLLD